VSIREGPGPHWTASVGAGHCEPGRAGGLKHWLTTIAPRRVRRRTLESSPSASTSSPMQADIGSTACDGNTSTSSTRPR
jgi:hypothetical protein